MSEIFVYLHDVKRIRAIKENTTMHAREQVEKAFQQVIGGTYLHKLDLVQTLSDVTRILNGLDREQHAQLLLQENIKKGNDDTISYQVSLTQHPDFIPDIATYMDYAIAVQYYRERNIILFGYREKSANLTDAPLVDGLIYHYPDRNVQTPKSYKPLQERFIGEATPKQISFVRKLLENVGRQLTVDNLSKYDAHCIINVLNNKSIDEDMIKHYNTITN